MGSADSHETIAAGAFAALIAMGCSSRDGSRATIGVAESAEHGDATVAGDAARGEGELGAGPHVATCHRADAGLDEDAGDAGTSSAMGGGDDSDDAHADWYACADDSDCIAVARVGCCHEGWMEAVNRGEAEAYEASFTCPEPHPICPQIRIIDRRVPECDRASHECTMVRVDRIRCGGFVRHPHSCPAGYVCEVDAGAPDLPGACVPAL
jgi:hypothetical protein